MGVKITIDSATLMNKGLELIEAHHLFALAASEIDVFVHPQSIVHWHGRVPRRFDDRAARRARHAHSDRACLAWPARIQGPAARLNLAAIGKLRLRAA